MARPHRLGLTPLQQQFIMAYDGDPSSTAEKLGMSPLTAAHWQRQDWFIEGLERRNEREAKRVSSERVAELAMKVLDRVELQAFWSDVVTNDEQSMRDRLAASKHLADSIGAFAPQKLELSGDAEKPIAVKSVDLEDRIKLLAQAGAKLVVHDFLQ